MLAREDIEENGGIRWQDLKQELGLVALAEHDTDSAAKRSISLN